MPMLANGGFPAGRHYLSVSAWVLALLSTHYSIIYADVYNSYFDYYHRSRTHLSLGKGSPEPRAIQPPEMGSVVTLPQVGESCVSFCRSTVDSRVRPCTTAYSAQMTYEINPLFVESFPWSDRAS